MKNKLLNTVVFYLLVLTIALIVLFPFLWMLSFLVQDTG
jgi:ABC-type glycerol-3-phosphate transport system permease component